MKRIVVAERIISVADYVIDVLMALIITGILYCFFSFIPAFDWRCALLYLIVRHIIADSNKKARQR